MHLFLGHGTSEDLDADCDCLLSYACGGQRCSSTMDALLWLSRIIVVAENRHLLRFFVRHIGNCAI